MLAIRIIINVLIIGLFLYSKLLPHQDKLNGQYKSTFNFFKNIFQPILDLLKKVIKPFQVGQGLAVDMTQIALLIILLLINNYF